MANYIEDKKPIITAYGVLFKRHTKVKTPLYRLIDNFIEVRTRLKAEMFKYPKGSDNYKKFNLGQLLAKLDCNAIYGILGQYSSMFYNLYVAASITAQGRASISHAITFFEQFLANNVKFSCLDEVIIFIENTIGETRTYDDNVVLDRNIKLEEAFRKIMLTCVFNWYPEEKELNIIWDIMSRLSQQDLNRLYYKNNIYDFCDNAIPTAMIKEILCKLDKPFLDPNKPPKEIKIELDEFLSLVKEYVYYGYQTLDKIDRVCIMERKVSIITDTDSTIVCFDPWYHYVLKKVKDIPMKI